jgi:hypothetical protein
MPFFQAWVVSKALMEAKLPEDSDQPLIGI